MDIQKRFELIKNNTEEIILEKDGNSRIYYDRVRANSKFRWYARKKFFDKTNAMYNYIPPKIREELREKYQKQLQSVESAFK